MSIESFSVVIDQPTEATAFIVDLRNFTPLLNSCGRDAQGISNFCHFLGDVYRVVLRCCLTSLPPQQRAEPPVYINSTGDGALVIYTGEWHFCTAFLAAILLDAELAARCRLFDKRHSGRRWPKAGFGIGVESGTVSRIVARPPAESARPMIETYIGECINIAARAEGATKVVARVSTVFSFEVIDLVATAIANESFREKSTAEKQCSSEAEKHQIHDDMRALRRKLCLGFLHFHYLKGVESPVPLYRLSKSAHHHTRPRVRDLLARLVRGNMQHLGQVTEHLDAE